jgi:beta-lactamase regulating signal transducer with metallopeptidase domain
MTDWMAERLLTGSVEGAVVITMVWLACRRLRWMPASVQSALWWLAALKMVVALLPIPAISLPLLPPPDLPPADLAVLDLMTAPAEPATIGNWMAIVMVIWLSGVCVQGVRLLLAFRQLRGVIRRSTPLAEDTVAVAAHLARIIGVTRIPQIRTSDEIEAPLVAGVHRPVVLLPSSLGSDDLPMAMCHELMHVRRHDLVLGWVPALAERLFFFHPLARLAAREYVMSREAACDAAVVRALGVPLDQYGRLLVRLGIARSEPAIAAGGAPASMSSLRRRLDMLQHPAIAGVSRRWRFSLVALAILAIVPFQLSAKSPSPQAGPMERATARPVAQAPEAPPREQVVRQEPTPDERAALAVAEAQIRAAKDQLAQAIERKVERESPQAPTPDERAALEVAEAQIRAAKDQLAQAIERNVERGAPQEPETTERFLRDRVAALAAQFEAALAQRDRLTSTEPIVATARRLRTVEEEYRQRILAAEKAMDAQRQAELRVRDRSESLTVQLDILRKQQEELLRQMQLISEQQKFLAEAQRQIAAETERLREALKSR